MLSDQEYQQLILVVNKLRTDVHLNNSETISEAALDDLKHKISQYELNNPEKIDPNSPSNTVSGGIAKGFQKYTHKSRMLSLNDIFDYKELQDWNERNVNYLKKESDLANNDRITPNPETAEFICEPKIDGLAISLIYENGLLVRAVTRGDGYTGEDVTENIRQIKSIPKNIPDMRSIEVRGEIFITKENFDKLNQAIAKGELIGKMGKTGKDGLFANSRNVASGTLRQLNPSIVRERNLSFIAYNVGGY